MNFRQFLEATHGDHESTSYSDTLYTHLRNILSEIKNRESLVKLVLACSQDADPQTLEVQNATKAIEDWLNGSKDSFTKAYKDLILVDHRVIIWCAFRIISLYGKDKEMVDTYTICAVDKAAEAIVKKSNLSYSESLKHYISIAQGLRSSISKFKSKKVLPYLTLDDEETFVAGICQMLDELEEQDYDEEPLFQRDSNGMYLNLPDFTPPLRIYGKDHEDLAKQIYNSPIKNSLFNYINHLHK